MHRITNRLKKNKLPTKNPKKPDGKNKSRLFWVLTDSAFMNLQS